MKFVHSDAYRALVRSSQQYDVIASEPSNPWVTGVEMLYSREFLTEARDRLTPGGVYCQWFHLYETSDEAVELVLKTYASVFDHIAVWSVNYADILLLGFRDASTALDVDRLRARLQQRDFRGAAPQMSFTSTSRWPWRSRTRRAQPRDLLRVEVIDDLGDADAAQTRHELRGLLDRLGAIVVGAQSARVRLLRPVQITVAPATSATRPFSASRSGVHAISAAQPRSISRARSDTRREEEGGRGRLARARRETPRRPRCRRP